jgi:hypothetical protein
MAQYTIFPDDVFRIEIEGRDGTKFRLSYEMNVLYMRQTITATGFDGDEGEDWVNVESYILDDNPGPGYRVGVRSEHWVIDQVYNPPILGFAGDENIDWGNIEKHQLP